MYINFLINSYNFIFTFIKVGTFIKTTFYIITTTSFATSNHAQKQAKNHLDVKPNNLDLYFSNVQENKRNINQHGYILFHFC